MNTYVLTEKGKQTAYGILAAFSEGYDLQQVAVLNDMEPDGVRAILRVIAAQAGIVAPVTDDDTFL